MLLPNKKVRIISHKHDLLCIDFGRCVPALILSIPYAGNLYAVDYLKREFTQHSIPHQQEIDYSNRHSNTIYILFCSDKVEEVISIVNQLQDKFADYNPLFKQQHQESFIDLEKQSKKSRKTFDREYIEQEM